MKEDNTPIDPTWMAETGGYARDMTLRDHYAGLAMEHFMGSYSPLEAALLAYEQADAMLKAREK
jgi:hypothetical protein